MRSNSVGLALLAATLVVPVARAEVPSPAQFGACAAIQGDLTRLQCYDDLARKTGVAPHSENAANGSAWQVDTETNPVDDTKTVVLATAAKNARSRFGKPIVLYLRCMSGKTGAYINWNDFLGEDEARLTVRFGSEHAGTESWPISTDKEASFVPGNVVAFIRKLAKVNEFVAQVTPYSESPVTAIFNTSGLAEAVKPLATTCGWKL